MKKPQLFTTGRILAAACLGVVASLGASADDVALTPTDEGRYNVTSNQRQSAINLSGGREVRAGTSGSDAVFEGFMVFDTSSVAGPMNSASLDFEIGNVIGSPGSLEVYGVSSAAGFDNTTLTNTQLEAMVNDGGTLIQNLGSPGTVTLNTNVTSFINAQRVAGNSTVGFLFKHTNVTDDDGTADQIQIWDSSDGAASVTQYPELNLSTVITQPTVAPYIYVTDRSPNGGVDRDLSTSLGTVTATPTLPTTTYEVELDFSSVGGGVETIAFDVDYSQTDGTGLQYNANGNVGVTGSNDNYVDGFENLTATATLNNTLTTYSGDVDIRLDTVFTELAGSPNVFNYLYSIASASSASGSAGTTDEFTMPAEGNIFESAHVTIAPFVSGTEIALEGLTIELALDGLPDIFSAYFYGDANGDGNVSLADLDVLGQNFGGSGNWSQGDFNGDGMVTLADLDLLGQNFGNGAAPLSQAEALAYIGAVPEPTSLALLGLGGLLVTRRRRG